MGKKSKKKVQWRRLSLNEISSNNTSKRPQRFTPDRDASSFSPVPRDWDNISPLNDDQRRSYNKRGANTSSKSSCDLTVEPSPINEENNFHEDEYSNYNNHVKNFSNYRYNVHDKNFHYSGANHPHFFHGDGMGMPRHEYHFNNRNGLPMERPPFKNFNHERPRFFNHGFPHQPHLDRFHRGDPVFNCPNGFHFDRRRPPFRVNGRPGNYNHFNGSLQRGWSNDEDGSGPYEKFGPCHSTNDYCHRDGSNSANGRDSNGYEGESSETQSESDERPTGLPPVQSIFIDNDQYTKIQTPRQEVIFKKNCNQSSSPNRVLESSDNLSNNSTTKRCKSNSTQSKNKRNKSDPVNHSKTDGSKKDPAHTSKKIVGHNKLDNIQQRKSQADSQKGRSKSGSVSKNKNSSKPNKEPTSDRSSPVRGSKQDSDETRCEDTPAADCELCPKSDDDDIYCQEEEAAYAPEIPDQFDGNFPGTGIEDPTLAGVIVHRLFPGGPEVAIPVRLTSTLDPSLIPGETALTPLDPAFTHLLDPFFQPLDASKWSGVPIDGEDQGLPSVVIPDTIIPVQHDPLGCPVTVQVKVDEFGNPLQIEPSSLMVQMSTLQHQHPSCPMVGFDRGFPLQYAHRYNNDHYRGNSFRDNYDEGLEKRLVRQIDEELAKHYSDDEGETREMEVKNEDGEEEAKKNAKQTQRLDSRDCEETSYDSQYASMSENSSLPTSPAGELSDSMTACPPNTPSTSGNVSPTNSEMVENSTPPPRGSSPIIFPHTSNASSSSVSIASASTFCASSSSSTLVSLSSSPINSGNPSKETSPSNVREIPLASSFSSTETLPTVEDDAESSAGKETISCQNGSGVNEYLSIADDKSELEIGVQPSASSDFSQNVSKNSSCVQDKCQSLENVRTTRKSEVLFCLDNCPETCDVSQVSNLEANEANFSAEDSAASTDNVAATQSTTAINDASTAGAENLVGLEHASKEAESYVDAANGEPINDIAAVTQDAPAFANVVTDAVPNDAGVDGSTVMVDENGVKVTVKQGYVMVPILTPYYDPSVLYGYSMMPSESSIDHSYPNACGNRKKKKKQNRRRAAEINAGNYSAADMYAGDPYIATADGYLLPMDASQMIHYPQPGLMPCIPTMTQYPYPVLHTGAMPPQYPGLVDEGFISVEHTPLLPEPQPTFPDNSAYPAQCCALGQEENPKFGPLEETEMQQIKEVLAERLQSKPEIPDVGLTDLDVPEADGEPKTDKNPTAIAQTSPEDVVDLKPESELSEEIISHDNESVDTKIACEAEIHNATSKELPPDSTVSLMDGGDESIPLAESSLKSEEANMELTTVQNSPVEVTPTEKLHNEKLQQSCDLTLVRPASASLENFASSESDPSTLKSTIELLDSVDKSSINKPTASTARTSESSVVIPEKTIALPEPLSLNHCNEDINTLVQSLSDDILTSIHDKDEASAPITAAGSRKEPSEEIISRGSNHIQPSRMRDGDRCSVSLLRNARDDVLESIAEESSGSLSDSSLSNEEPEYVSKITEEMESALSLLHTRVERRDLPVTEAVKRWMREVTPEKIFTLTEVDDSCINALRLNENSLVEDYSDDDSYDSESEHLLPPSYSDIKESKANIDQSSKNVRGNPFGSAQRSEICVESTTKRVANSSFSLDILDEYDGCSSVSGLSQGPLFSASSSLLSSQSSSRTLTPSRSFQEGDDPEDDTIPCSCHPGGYKKYYQLAIDSEDSPSGSSCPESPCDCTHLQASSSDRVLPLAAEILRTQHLDLAEVSNLENSNADCTHLPENSAHLKLPASYSSACSSGLGSSVATTPADSPQRLPSHFSAPRFPFVFLPPNIAAETGPASLNNIHCCSIM
ncbi:serine-rich adhesin for platelets [Hyalella azteca]|uniref:Serine-rich adhesin for platelets n=1 Tax=Hyalella azteca TaxID=294128 RepID=A0A8B7PMK1_HYAAZ|nr:serine-rich adhesin for platelets [Hyalella azteca]